MKKVLFFLIVLLLLGLVVYLRLSSQGWTFFSQEVAEAKTGIHFVASTTPLLFVGDIMLGRYIETQMKQRGDSYPFAKMKDFLNGHITIANLEGPIPEIHTPTPIGGLVFSFPIKSVGLLRGGGVRAVSLANNHMFDKGSEGYLYTKQVLTDGNVASFGTYTPTKEDYFETKIGTTTVVVYGINMIAIGWDEQQAYQATEKIRHEHPNSLLIAFIHWGNEYDTQNVYQRAFAHTLIDKGVDAIIGSHPHVVQGIELYREKPIMYSLGNFIFDQYFSADVQKGLVVSLAVKGGFYEYGLSPTKIIRSVPELSLGASKDAQLRSLAKQSDKALEDSIIKGFIRIKIE